MNAQAVPFDLSPPSGTTPERRNALLLEAFKVALAEPGEQRLYRAGKLSGLFPSRAGAAHDAAEFALQAGYLEKTRTETKGKTDIDWVKLTPAGVAFVHDQDSPRAVLLELRDTLASARSGIPASLEWMRADFEAFATQAALQLQKVAEKVDALAARVEEALRRADAIGPALSPEMDDLVPWGLQALTYLDQRRETGAARECDLPELFAAIGRTHPEMSRGEFHDGLRRLRDNGAIRLLPSLGDDLHEPEYALLDGAAMLYYAKR